MKTGKGILSKAPAYFEFRHILISSLGLLLALSGGVAQAQAGASPSLDPWLGTWRIIDEGAFPEANAVDAGAIVEIGLTADGRGLEISRQTPEKTAVRETLIPDGVARSIEAAACTGTQTARWLPEAGAIAGSSEMSCKETVNFTTSSLRLLLPEGRMADILAVKTLGQTRLAVRRLANMGITPSSDNRGEVPKAALIAVQANLSAPWTVDQIIQLSSLVDGTVLEAALLEKNSKLVLSAGVLRRLKAGGVSEKVMDLLVALAFPGEFEIQKNGQFEIRPPSPSLGYGFASSRVDLTSRGLMLGEHYYPGVFYGCSPDDTSYHILTAPYAGEGYYSEYNCWTYYTPGWIDYPIYFYPYPNYPHGSNDTVTPASNGRLNANTGYTQVEIRDTGRRAVAREDYDSRTGSAVGRVVSGETSSSSGSASSGGSSSSGSSGSGSSGSGSSSPGASPDGYSSGRDDGGGSSARPR